jgi:hypothetical protein
VGQLLPSDCCMLLWLLLLLLLPLLSLQQLWGLPLK